MQERGTQGVIGLKESLLPRLAGGIKQNPPTWGVVWVRLMATRLSVGSQNQRRNQLEMGSLSEQVVDRDVTMREPLSDSEPPRKRQRRCMWKCEACRKMKVKCEPSERNFENGERCDQCKVRGLPCSPHTRFQKEVQPAKVKVDDPSLLTPPRSTARRLEPSPSISPHLCDASSTGQIHGNDSADRRQRPQVRSSGATPTVQPRFSALGYQKLGSSLEITADLQSGQVLQSPARTMRSLLTTCQFPEYRLQPRSPEAPSIEATSSCDSYSCHRLTLLSGARGQAEDREGIHACCGPIRKFATNPAQGYRLHRRTSSTAASSTASRGCTPIVPTVGLPSQVPLSCKLFKGGTKQYNRPSWTNTTATHRDLRSSRSNGRSRPFLWRTERPRV